MTREIKDAVNDLGQAFEAFKQANDLRLNEIARKGSADVLTETKVNRLNDEVSRTQGLVDMAKKRLDQLETALKRSPVGETGDEQKEANVFAVERKTQSGVEMSPSQYAEYKKSFKNYIRRNNAGADVDEIKALSAGSDPDGGYFVTPDVSGRIVELLNETSPIRQVANVVTIGTDTLEGVAHLGEAGAGWVGETDARDETDSPTISQWSIPVHELYAEPRATQRLLDDALFNVDEWLSTKIAERLSRLENDAFVNGNTSGRPKGFLTYPAGVPSSSTYKVIEQVLSGGTGDFAATTPGDALINMVFSLKAAYRENAVFMMKRSTLAEVRKLKDENDNYLWTPDFQTKQGGTLLGFDVIEAEDMPAIAEDSLSIAFGDFKAGYQIVDRQGIRILRDNVTTKPYVKFYTTKRVGGDVVDFDAIKLMKFAAA